MSDTCLQCGSATAGARFCAKCGAPQPEADAAPKADPLVGTFVAGRYEIVELLSAGGMGKVYRGIQRPLDRAVAVKFMHPELQQFQEVAERFMVEARAASALNHPNVISIYDFGQTRPEEGGMLFMVMEFLTGRDLAHILLDEPPLPFPRTADILRQTLHALGEAHAQGVTHRDVKPDNIVVEATRGGGDRVKVIDFGIAKVGAGRKLTQVGQALGTPHYMAPEQCRGDVIDARADLYSVGAVLFEMLTGRVPFEDDSPTKILVRHMEDPRPDPREVAPERNVPAALAEVCLKAMSIDPLGRFASAEEFADALTSAATSRSFTSRDASVFPDRRTSRPAAAPLPTEHLPVVDPVASSLLGRGEDVAWLVGVTSASRHALVHGEPGVGLTALLDAAATGAEQAGARLCRPRRLVAPANEVSHAAARSIVSALAALDEGDARLGTGELAEPGKARDGLRILFGADADLVLGGQERVRRACSAALEWAVRSALAGGGPLLLVVDDLDRLDGASQLVIADLLWDVALPGFSLLASARTPTDQAFGDKIVQRHVRGLPANVAAELAARDGVTGGLPDSAEVDPLYVELHRTWSGVSPAPDAPPTSVRELVAAVLEALTPAGRRVLHALAVVGACDAEALTQVVEREEEVSSGLRELEVAGLSRTEGGVTFLHHATFAQVALEKAPVSAIQNLHRRAAALLPPTAPVELRAHHAIRGEPGFEAFLLVDEAASLRLALGDHDGSVRLLSDALQAVRSEYARGNVEVADAGWVTFGLKLGSALLGIGSADQADAVLRETLEHTASESESRARVMADLAVVALQRNSELQAEDLRRSALLIAQRVGATTLADRLREPLEAPPPASVRRLVSVTTGKRGAPGRTSDAGSGGEDSPTPEFEDAALRAAGIGAKPERTSGVPRSPTPRAEPVEEEVLSRRFARDATQSARPAIPRTDPAPSGEHPKAPSPPPVPRTDRASPKTWAPPTEFPKSVLLVVEDRAVADRLARAFRARGAAVTASPNYRGIGAFIGPFDAGVFALGAATFDLGEVRAVAKSGNVKRIIFYGVASQAAAEDLARLGPVMSGDVSGVLRAAGVR